MSNILSSARKGVSNATDEIYAIFLKRQECMQAIAEAKVFEISEILEKEDLSVVRLQREVELLEEYANRAEQDGEDPELVKMLIWFLMYAGKMKQLSILGKETVFGKEKLEDKELIDNLINLTKAVASNYDTYGEDFNGTLLVREFEEDIIKKISCEIGDKGLAVDLGTANGNIARLIKKSGFKKVIAYDISPDMLKRAKSYNDNSGIIFEETNLFEGIPLGNLSSDFIVSSFGSASEVNKNILKEVNRVLKPGGKAFLSFYNEDSITNNWWQPLQSSIGVIFNKDSNLLEVPIFGDNPKVYKVYAKSYSLEKIELEISSLGLNIDSVGSFSPALTLTPSLFLDSEDRFNSLKNYEKQHYGTGPYLGFYITIVVSKDKS